MALTPREHAVLEHLLRRRGRTLSKDALAEAIFGFDDTADPSAIEIYVHRLRKKLEGSAVASPSCGASAICCATMRASPRRQLFAWVLLPLAVLAALNAVASRLSARAAADLVTDRTVLASARTIAEQAHTEEGRIEVLIPPAALEMFDTGDPVHEGHWSADRQIHQNYSNANLIYWNNSRV